MERHVFELLNRERDEHCHEEHHHHHLDKNRSSCRVYGQYLFKVGDLVSYDSTLRKLVSSTSTIIDFIVVDVDEHKHWIEIANTGVYSIGRQYANGIIYNNGTGKIDYTPTSDSQSIGAIINGFILVNVSRSSGSGSTGPIVSAVNADWNATSGLAEILNKPTIFSGVYGDLTGLPVLFSGDYNDLTNKPVVTPQVNADWDAVSGISQILNKPSIFSGNYNDLTNKPVLFSGRFSDLSGTPLLFDGNYNSLTNKPTIPAEYLLPIASATTLGGFKVGTNLAIDSNGVLSASFTVKYADVTNKPNKNKVLSIATPSIGDNMLILFTDSAIKISSIKGIIQGDANSQVTIQVYTGTDRRLGTPGSRLLTQGAISDYATGTSLTVLDADSTIAANSFVYVTINTTVGNPTMLELIAIYGDV